MRCKVDMYLYKFMLVYDLIRIFVDTLIPQWRSLEKRMMDGMEVGSPSQGGELEAKENKCGKNVEDKNFKKYWHNVGLVFSRVDPLFIVLGGTIEHVGRMPLMGWECLWQDRSCPSFWFWWDKAVKPTWCLVTKDSTFPMKIRRFVAQIFLLEGLVHRWPLSLLMVGLLFRHLLGLPRALSRIGYNNIPSLWVKRRVIKWPSSKNSVMITSLQVVSNRGFILWWNVNFQSLGLS